MKPKLSHVAAAAAVVGVLGLGGMSIAYAQDSSTTGDDPAVTTPDDSTTTSPQDPSATNDDNSANRDENCPERSGAPSDSPSTEGSSL